MSAEPLLNEKGRNTMTDYDNTNVQDMTELAAEIARGINGERDGNKDSDAE